MRGAGILRSAFIAAAVVLGQPHMIAIRNELKAPKIHQIGYDNVSGRPVRCTSSANRLSQKGRRKRARWTNSHA